MTAAQDLADALAEVADLHDRDCPDRDVWARLADLASPGADAPAPEVTR